MSRRSWSILAGGAAVATVVAVVFLWILPRTRAEEVAYRTDAVQKGDVRVQVIATGTLNPVTTVLVGSQISGTVSAMYADFNSHVKAGQVVAQIDPTFLQAQVAQNEADLERAQVTVRQAERDYARLTPLKEKGLAPQADIDAAESAVEAARAGVKSAEAALLRARTNLKFATITSPIDGIVVSRDVDIGQTVAASLSAPTLFTIAKDLSEMQLEAAVDEADIGSIQVGQSVEFTVDAFPEKTFHGTVHQVRLAPTTDQNVVTYTVIARVENPEQRLLPGMTANATVVIQEVRDVLRVPVAALRFRPGDGRGNRDGREGTTGTAQARPASASGATAATGTGGGRSKSEDGAPGGGRRGTAVYVLGPKGDLSRIGVKPGLSDGTFTEVSSDSLSEGMQVVVSRNSSTTGGSNQSGTVNPFTPQGRPPRGAR
jgi:HlyD family secretion protein